MSSIDTILNDIITSTKSTKSSVDQLLTQYLNQSKSNNDHPELIQNLLKKTQHTSSKGKLEGVSLLDLKNESLVSYINNLILIVLSALERLDKEGTKENDERLDVIKRSIIQRVSFERGIKPLEKKINYQLDKMVRTYGRMEQDELKAEQKLHQDQDKESDEEEGSDDESDSDDSESEDDNLQYRPDASALSKLASSSSKKTSTKGSSSSSGSGEKYKPPKISAMAPPTAISHKESTSGADSGKNRKVQSMEEYLQEQSDMPTSEVSIGSSIINHGRGGVKTSHDYKKEKEVQTYEEANFVRLPTNQTKKNFKEKQRDLYNQFAGEDWSMFNDNKKNNDVTRNGTSRKRKAGTVWDKVKKKKGY